MTPDIPATHILLLALGGLAFSLIVSLLSVLEFKRYAQRLGIVDQPDHRKIHTTPIPRIGGIGIIFGFFAGILFFDLAVGLLPEFTGAIPKANTYLLTGAIVIAVTGLVDDFRGISFRQKLVVQSLVAVFIIKAGYRLHFDFGIFPGYASALSIPITFIWIIGVTNAVNLIDGLDGLAGGVFLIALITITACLMLAGQAIPFIMVFCITGAVLGFLLVNWHPAKVFMGDTGSLFLGYIIACYSLQATAVSSGFFIFLIPVFAVGLPVFDTLLSMTRRALKGRPMFYPDKDHIHHRIKRVFGYNQRGTVYMLYGISLVFGGLALALSLVSTFTSGLLITLGGAAFLLLLLWKLEYLSIKKIRSYIRQNSRKRKTEYVPPTLTFGR